MRFPVTAGAAVRVGLALICGACGSCGNNASVALERAGEHYSQGFLVSAPAMSANRAAHTATAVPDGRVLIAGGFVAEPSVEGVLEREGDPRFQSATVNTGRTVCDVQC